MRRFAAGSLAGILAVVATSLVLGAERPQPAEISIPQTIEKSIKNLEKHKTARFLMKMKIWSKDTMFFLMDLTGETMPLADKSHVKGKVGFLGIMADMEKIQIGDTEYQRDDETGVWKKVEKKEEEKGEESKPQGDPLKTCGDLAKGSQFKPAGETKLRGITCLVYRFRPTNEEIKKMGKGAQAEGRILIGKEDQALRKLFIQGSGKDPKVGKMEFSFHLEFYDFDAPITIEPPKMEEK